MTAMAKVEVLRAACCVAGADGKVDDSERNLLVELADRVGVGEASLNAMILRAETEKDFYEKQFQVLKSDPDATMRTLIRVAGDNRKIDPSEVEMLRHFASRLGMPEDRYSSVAQSVLGELNQ